MPTFAWNGLLVVLSLGAGLAVCEAALRLADTRYEQAAEPPLRTYRWPNTHPHPDAKTEHKVLYNSFGNRQHRDFSERDLQAGTHIAFFGDSFTEARNVPAQYAFTEVLDHLLNAQAGKTSVHVHNFGVEATGPGSQYLRYRGFPRKDRLRHVFYVHCFNDFADLRRSGAYALSATGDLVRRMRQPAAGWMRFLSGLRLTYFALDVWQRLAGPEDAPHERDPVFEALLSRWRDEAEANGSAFHIVLLPRPRTAASFHRRVEAGLFDVFDLRGCFAEEIPGYDWEDWRFKSDYHWNEAAHMVAAHCLYRFLESRLGLEKASDETLAQARHAYYQAFADDTDWQGHRFMPAAPWASPVPVDAAEAASIRAKHLALERATEDQRHRIVREMRQGQPRARHAGWDVYASTRHRAVVYVKSPCDEADPAGGLFLRAVPAGMDAEGGPFLEWRRHSAFWREGEECVVVQPLPKKVLAKIRTGEYLHRRGGSVLWEAEFPFDSAEQLAAVAAAYQRDYDAFANAPPKARSLWNMHVLDRRLAFLKAPCDAADLRGSFFVRLYPGDAADPIQGRRGFRSGSFPVVGNWGVVSANLDGKCLFWIALPRWPVATIWAGQRIREAVLWETTFHLDVERFRRTWAAVRSKAPAARGDFDIHRRGAELVYVREPCAEQDAAARFFLHVFTGAERANLDFDFKERGAVVDGRCVAVARLPEQDIDRIRTGQFDASGTLWSVEI